MPAIFDIKNPNRKDWKKYRFDQIAHSISERVEPQQTDLDVYVGLEHIDPESLHIKRWGTPKDVNGTKLKVYPGDLIFGKRRAYQRKAAIANFEGICSAHAMVLRANEEVINQKLFPFFMHSDAFMQRAMDISVGSLSPTINWGTLKTQEFLLPPKEQQAKLAELLWAADEVVEAYREMAHQNYKVLQVYQKEQFERVANQNLKNIGSFSSGATPLRSDNIKYFKNGTIPWVKTLDLNNDIIASTEEKITAIAIKETHCKIHPKETVLVAMYGGFNQIGRTGLLDIEAATNQAIVSIRLDKAIVLPKFILYQINAKREYWKVVAVSSRKDPNITKTDVENLPIYLPSISEQEKIVNGVDKNLVFNKHIQQCTTDMKNLQGQLINSIFGV